MARAVEEADSSRSSSHAMRRRPVRQSRPAASGIFLDCTRDTPLSASTRSPPSMKRTTTCTVPQSPLDATLNRLELSATTADSYPHSLFTSTKPVAQTKSMSRASRVGCHPAASNPPRPHLAGWAESRLLWKLASHPSLPQPLPASFASFAARVCIRLEMSGSHTVRATAALAIF